MASKLKKAYGVAMLAVLALAGFAAMLLLIGAGVGPLCFSDGWVRARILWRTPLGSSTNQVLTLINKYHWPPCSESAAESAADGGHVEEREIGVTHDPFETYVIAYWIFDRNGRLVDVRILDDRDSL